VTGRKQLHQPGVRDVRLLVRDDDRRPEQRQRKALFSFSKKPSSGR
jgi:hypothetical protein